MKLQIGTFLSVFAIAAMVSAPITFYTSGAEAKGSRSSSSFRSSGTRSSGFKSFGKSKSSVFSKKSSATVSSTSKCGTKAHKATTVTPTKSNGGMNRTQLSSMQQSSKASHIASQSKFKSTTASNTSTSTSSQRKFARRAGRDNDYGTYYTRRSNYYGSYNAPSYVYTGASSFGVWDTVFLYYMLGTPSHASAFGYNHYGDPGYSAWRAQANIQARENVELRAQLAAIDAGAAGMTGDRNEEYIPPGMDADLALASELVEANKPVFRVCTGEADGTYAKIGNLYKRSVTSASVELVSTSGSMQNLEYMAAGKCDASFIQSDAYWAYFAQNDYKGDFNLTRIPLPYRETAHLVCNARTDADTIDELTSANTVYLGQEGSGASVTWANLITENSDLKHVLTRFGTRSEIQNKVGSDANACLMYVGAMDSDRILRLANMSESVKMIDIADSDYLDVVNPAQNRVYKAQEIDSDHYANLSTSSWGFDWDIDTITVGAEVAVSDTWTKASGDTLSYKVMKQIQGTKVDVDHLNRI